MPGIGIITNANARIHRMFPFFHRFLKKMVGRRGNLIATLSIDELEKTVRDFLNQDLDIIAISGGDGTIHRTLDALLKATDNPSELPMILTLPSGTMNIIPRALGISGGTVSNLMSTVFSYNHDLPMRVVKRNILQVNGDYSMLFGMGAPVRILKVNYEQGKSRFGASAMFIKYFSDLVMGAKLFEEILAPFSSSFTFDDDKPVSIEAHTLFASFTEKLPFGFRFFPLSTKRRGEFETVFLDLTPRQAFSTIPRMWGGNPREFKGVLRKTASRLLIENKEPMEYTLDGDIYPAKKEFKIVAGPELRFIVPPGISYIKPGRKPRTGKTPPWGKYILR
ncbi:MAG: hypothetical protein JXR95_09270 [Deltaproteobacteria bacterium]|nr:hypothetical protein [Deltaproteobacteria bacterium]